MTCTIEMTAAEREGLTVLVDSVQVADWHLSEIPYPDGHRDLELLYDALHSALRRATVRHWTDLGFQVEDIPDHEVASAMAAGWITGPIHEPTEGEGDAAVYAIWDAAVSDWEDAEDVGFGAFEGRCREWRDRPEEES